ncbi:alpha/beta-hydrolase [Laetiporus sulphureus 93-53]|uniref:triacylglycerol lipase n=1 Tax=Laetiporus sulphureus 93-53 TaxID=1314785 RepID=A0A165H396_9APHY|nr:alpha/beta-hydrolase [Laetiporus sulphureus 93-53]KZT11184.1 alpha/beta-hydrolase [Laetiporus sulphureus 93-53]
MLYNLLPHALQYLVASLLLTKQPATPHSLVLELRHEHGLSDSGRVVFADIDPSRSSLLPGERTVNSRNVKAHRPASHESFSSARFNNSASVLWDEVDIEGPDTQDRETLRALAKMTNNAYYEPIEKSWYDLGPDWDNQSYPFGWEPDADGFRGYVFATPDNSTVVISVKGTSAGWLVGGGGPTTRKDKFNDNLLFSCCCARVGPTWSPVCDCYEGGHKCDQGCLEKNIAEDSLFYSVGTNLYYNVTYMYPNANIWLVGHSLGGSLASLVGLTFGVPVVAFEAPGEKLAARRLHLPFPPSTQHITHVYHTADPIAMGICNGVSSSCAIAGYAMETRCHLGNTILYDTITKLKWSADIRTHSIRVIVDKLLAEDWDTGDGNGGEIKAVPEPKAEDDCVDCFDWEFGDYRNASVSTCGHSFV